MEWDYTVQSGGTETPLKSSALAVCDLTADKAPFGQVLREIARQADISLIYPASLDSEIYTGKLFGPADAVLDALARRSEKRFSLNNGVGLIGTPLPEDRSIGVLRTWFADPAAIVSPLLSETGKVSASGGYCFISDRSETVYRVLTAMASARPRVYAFQVLEIYTADSFDASFSIENLKGMPMSYNPQAGFTALLSASVEDRGVYIGRTWTGLITEGRPFEFLQGQAEARTTTVVQQSSPLIQNQTFVTTGWHLDVTITGKSVDGLVNQDATDLPQYRIPFSCGAPGLYLVNTSTLTSIDGEAGIPYSFMKTGSFTRHIWVRYHEAGVLVEKPPGEAVVEK